MPDGNPRGSLGRTVLVDEELQDVLPGRLLRVRVLEVDEVGIRVRYEVRPPIVERPTPRNASWLLTASDDLGNRYTSAGGAYGVAPSGGFTEGVHSLTPPPATGATYIDLGFIGPGGGEDELPQQVVRVPLT